MKTSTSRINGSKQPIFAYEQYRIDAAKQKSDSRTISRAMADKAREESIKATAEYNKGLLDVEKLRIDLEKSRLDAEKAKSETIKAQTDLEKSRLDSETVHAKLETIKALEKSRLDSEKSKSETIKALEKSRLDAETVHAKLETIKALEQSYITNADKAHADSLMLVQRSKIMKMLQVLSVTSCKRVDELYFNKSVTSITNIYQKTYNNNKYASGFGDFIRGCYFLLEFCEMFYFQPNIVINHPLKEFLENSSTTDNDCIDDNTVSMFEDNNWKKHVLNSDNIIVNTIRKSDAMTRFVHYLCSSTINNNNINIYNILFPYFEVSSEHQKVMRDILKPSQEIQEYVASTLETFELTKNKYISIHIRSGDNYLNCANKQFKVTYLNNITHNITALLNKHPNTSFLLIADNNFVKFYLSDKKIDRLYIIFNEIGHLGENTQLDRNKIKNTMLDFYLFSYSSMIYSFSSYEHGSGFSFWCAKTYDIPYSCKIIKQ